MIIKVVSAKYLNDYKIELLFNNGIIKITNLENELDGEVFKPLKDLNTFKSFSIATNTIEWANGADFASEYLYMISDYVTPADKENDSLMPIVNKLYEIAN